MEVRPFFTTPSMMPYEVAREEITPESKVLIMATAEDRFLDVFANIAFTKHGLSMWDDAMGSKVGHGTYFAMDDLRTGLFILCSYLKDDNLYLLGKLQPSLPITKMALREFKKFMIGT
jgi:hypothetical protein